MKRIPLSFFRSFFDNSEFLLFFSWNSGVKTRERWIDCLWDPLVPPWGHGHTIWDCKDWHSAGHVGMCEENRTWTPGLSESQGWGATFAERLDGTDQHQGRWQFCPRAGVQQWPIRHHGSRRETCEKPHGEVPCARRGRGLSVYSRPRAPDKGSHLRRGTEVCGAEEYIVGSDIFLTILWANLRGENGDDLANCSTCRWRQMDIGVYMLPAVDGRGRGNRVKRCNLHLEKGFQLYMNFIFVSCYVNWIMRKRKWGCNYSFVRYEVCSFRISHIVQMHTCQRRCGTYILMILFAYSCMIFF